MIFGWRKKAEKNKFWQNFLTSVRKVGYVFFAFFCVWFFISGLNSRTTSTSTPHLLLAVDDVRFEKAIPTEAKITRLPDSKIVLPKRQCLNNGRPEDFLYQEEEIKIKATETLNVEKAREVFEVPTTLKLASLVPSAVSMKIIPQNKEIFEEIKRIDSLRLDDKTATERLEKLYEEDLPDDVIVADPHEGEETQNPDVHTNQRNIKDIPVKIYHKPLYFGPEPVLAVVIDDMGISLSRTKDIISLKAPLTSSFLTYGRNLKEQIAAARSSGHEIMAHIPMEPKKHIDVAPDVLTVAMNDEEIRRGFEEMLKKFGPLSGINNHMGSRFTEDRHRMEIVMRVLHERNMFFLDSKTSPQSQGRQAAKSQGVDYAFRNVFLDNENNFDYINRQLQLAEKLARRNGYAIVIGHPKSQTYKALQAWLPTLEEKKIQVVPLSRIVAVLNQSH